MMKDMTEDNIEGFRALARGGHKFYVNWDLVKIAREQIMSDMERELDQLRRK